MSIYYIISFFSLFLSTLFFWKQIIVSGASLFPIIIALISIIQSVIFKSYWNSDNSENTAFSLREIDDESYKASMKWHYICKSIIIPTFMVFVIFFNNTIKIVIPISIYFMSYLPVRLLVKFDHKK